MKIVVNKDQPIRKLVGVHLQHVSANAVFQRVSGGTVVIFGRHSFDSGNTEWTSLEAILENFRDHATPIYEGDSVTIQF